MDERLPRAVTAAGIEGRGLEQSEHPQARTGSAGAAWLRGRDGAVPRVWSRAARHAVERELPLPLPHRDATGLCRIPVAVQRNVGARAAGARALRASLPKRRSDAAATACQGTRGAAV